MGRYITHEQLPFKGRLVKIRLRNYGFNSISNSQKMKMNFSKLHRTAP